MDLIYRCSPEEVLNTMKVIGETFKLGSRLTSTGRGKRVFNEMFPNNQDAVMHLVDRCKYAYSHGLSEAVDFTAEELIMLKQLERYVLAL